MNTKKTKLIIMSISVIILLFCIFKYILNTHVEASDSKSEAKCTTRETNLQLSPEEKRLLVAFIHAETTSNTYEEKLAIANVVINRVHSKDYPSNIEDIIYEDNAFTSVDNGALDKHLWEYDCGKFNTSHHLNTVKAVTDALSGLNNIDNRLNVSHYWPKANYSKYKNTCIIEKHIFW